MHEVAICQSIVREVENQFPREDIENIREIHVRIGVLSCVEPIFLEQVYKMMVGDGDLQHSVLKTERINILAHCNNCKNNFKVENSVFVCPACATPSSSIIEGNELRIIKIILEEPAYEKTH